MPDARLRTGGREHRGDDMLKALCWLSVTIGFGWTALLAFPPTVIATLTLAQGSIPTFDAKDWANLGGFGLFAIAMYVLHRQTVADFRSDMKEERTLREKHMAIVIDNTAATKDLSVVTSSLASALSTAAHRRNG